MSYVPPLAAERNSVPQEPDVNDVERPAGFDAATFPILAEHWFGISPAGVGVDTVATAA